MKFKAICIRCGSYKKNAFDACKECDLKPASDFEAARALILSEKTMYGNASVGKPLEELVEISKAIKSGRPYPIDGDEQNRVVRVYYEYLQSQPAPKWYQSKKFKWIVAGIIFLAILAGALIYTLQ